MDGRNSNGRRISLLNDDEPKTTSSTGIPHHPAASRHHSYSSTSSGYSCSLSSSSVARLASSTSRSSSSSSTPCLSPQTPHLVRSTSTDSAAEMQTPSPITPEFGFVDPMVAQQQQQQQFMADPAAAYFPKESFPQFAPQQQVGQPQLGAAGFAPAPAYYHAQPAAEPTAAPQPAQKSKKNQYPCPVAKQYNCSDYFTTSGHAARHAKKHTGKKDALCPDCNKAFTRKDNMEQHRRTHLTGRNATKGTSSGEKGSKVQKSTASRRPKPAPIQAAQPAALLVDPSLPLPISPTSSFNMTPTAPQALMDPSYPAEFLERSMYPDPSQCAINPGPRFEFNSPSFGLDTLALAAASGEKRNVSE